MGQMRQSCGVPRKQKPQGGGSHVDGSKFTNYCSYFYTDGAFLAPDIAAAEMQKIGIHAMKEKGVPRPIGWLLTRNVPRPSRWRT